MPLSTISQLYLGGQFTGQGNRKKTEKTTDLPQVTDKLYRIMSYRVHLVWAGFKLTKLVVIDTDCTGCNKSNYHTITTAPKSTWIHQCLLYCLCLLNCFYFSIKFYWSICYLVWNFLFKFVKVYVNCLGNETINLIQARLLFDHLYKILCNN